MTIITLLTDFGLADTYVGEMKGVLVTQAPSAHLVDLSHEVSPGSVREAQYLLGRAWRRFPDGTIHLSVIDPEVGSGRRAVAIHAYDHFFVGPDNGLFTEIIPGASAVSLPIPPEAAPTFHGRDVFAPAAAALAVGAELESLGEPVSDPVRLEGQRPTEHDGGWTGQVVHIDRFGTLITNLPGTLTSSESRVRVGDFDVGSVRVTFAEVDAGAVIALVGSGGTVEIAVRHESAMRRLGVGVGVKVELLR